MNLLLEFILLRFIRVHSKLDSIILATFVHLQSFFSLFLKTTFPQFVVISIHLIAPFVPLSVRSRTKRVGEPQSFHTDSNTQETMVILFFFVKSALSPCSFQPFPLLDKLRFRKMLRGDLVFSHFSFLFFARN